MKYFLILLLLVSCQSASKKESPPLISNSTPQIVPVSLDNSVLTNLGENSQAKFAPSGNKIIFVSRNRLSHRKGQIYELDLTTRQERRLTYNDGEASWPSYLPDQKSFLYSCDTDEQKEDPLWLRSSLEKIANKGAPKTESAANIDSPALDFSEIYWSTLDGSMIRRLTKSKGFDGMAVFDKNHRRVFFVNQVAAADRQIYQLNWGAVQPRAMTQGSEPHSDPALSADGKLIAYVSKFDLTLTDLQFKIPRLIAKNAASPTWHPNGEWLVFSGKDASKKDPSKLWFIKVNGECLSELKSEKGDSRFPSFSPDGQSLIYTNNRSGTDQIYIMKFNAPETCAKSADSTKVK